MNDQYGYGGRDQFNIAGDAYFIRDDSSKSDKPDEAEFGAAADGQDTQGSPGGGAFLFFLVAGIVGLFIWGSLGGNSLPTVRFPSHSDRWPVGSSRSLVLGPVTNRLRACSRAPVLSPANCPQSISASDAVASPTPWRLYGDPADGAHIVFWKNRFYVAGVAVMRATYSDDNGDELSVQIVHYRAILRWLGGAAELSSIRAVSASSGPRIVKHEPLAPWSQLMQAVRASFIKCARSTSAPLPPQCPTEQGSDIIGSKARWRLTDDPLLNATKRFDSSTGLIHVSGSFSLKVTYNVFLLGIQHGSEADNYDATVAVDGPKMTVLQITVSK